jgi:UDP-glucose 4-epimerase
VHTNVIGTAYLARIAETLKIPLVYSSTGSVYMPIHQEPPITEWFPVAGNSVYGVTKLGGELEITASEDLPWIILRYAHLYGREKRDAGLVGTFVDRIQRGLRPTLYGGQQSNDFTYIDDVVQANLLALDAPDYAWEEVYNIGTGEEVTAKAAADAIADILEYREGFIEEPQREVDAPRFVYDVSKAEAKLGFKAQYTFREGLERMVTHG